MPAQENDEDCDGIQKVREPCDCNYQVTDSTPFPALLENGKRSKHSGIYGIIYADEEGDEHGCNGIGAHRSEIVVRNDRYVQAGDKQHSKGPDSERAAILCQ